MTKSTQTLTQSGLLAVLVQRQRYIVFQLARRSARRKRVHAAFWNTLTWARRAAHGAKAGRRARPTLESSRRPADQISRMGRAKWRILHVPPGSTRYFDANGDPTSQSLLLIVPSNRE
jgi:hypothetical protein